MIVDYAIALIAVVALFLYLGAALLKPEWFQ
jgi:K+-transporting ATPase KdpF subunit